MSDLVERQAKASAEIARLRSEVERLTTARAADARVEKALENDLMDARKRAMALDTGLTRARAAISRLVAAAEEVTGSPNIRETALVELNSASVAANTLFNELKESKE